MSKHTPEPWVIDKSKWIAAQWGTFEDQSRGEPNCAGDELPAIVSCRDPDGNDDHDLAIRPRRADQQNRRLAHAENVANLARICACVNALAGLNPAGVKGLVEAAQEAMKHVTCGHLEHDGCAKCAARIALRTALSTLHSQIAKELP